ncbi:MAG: tetratricopeptide repeat protein [Pseudomonadota bacterium]
MPDPIRFSAVLLDPISHFDTVSFMRRLGNGLGGLAALTATSCAGTAGNSAKSSAAAARVEIPAAPELKCDPTSAAAPLVLTLAPEQRGDIEALMKQQIVTMRYECDKLVPVADCTVDGSYGFVSVTPREQIMSISSELELRANLPLESSTLLGRVAAALSTGSRLDIAFSIVGQQTSVLRAVNRSQLKGECSTVTHFVHGASLGAYAIALAKGAPESIDEVFGGSSKLLQRDGALEACRKQGNDDERIAGCSAPLRLELRPVTDDAAPASARDEEQPALRCPAGTQLDDLGKCVVASSSAPYVCSFADHADCAKQCQAGSAGSCSLLGRNYELGRGVKKDRVRAEHFYNLACRSGSPPGCGRLGEMLADRSATRDEGLTLLLESCRGGFFEACEARSARLPANTSNEPIDLARRGCAGGNAASCWSLGQFYREGLGIEKNAAEATRYFKLACDGEAPSGCVSYAELIDPGKVATPETPRALELLRSACDRNIAAACSQLGIYYGLGKGVPTDFPKSMAFIERACLGGDFSSCLVTGLSYERGLGHTKDLAKAQQFLIRACEVGDKIACKESERLRSSLAQKQHE